MENPNKTRTTFNASFTEAGEIANQDYRGISRKGTFRQRPLLSGQPNPTLPTTFKGQGTGEIDIPYKTVDVSAKQVYSNRINAAENGGVLSGTNTRGMLSGSGTVLQEQRIAEITREPINTRLGNPSGNTRVRVGGRAGAIQFAGDLLIGAIKDEILSKPSRFGLKGRDRESQLDQLGKALKDTYRAAKKLLTTDLTGTPKQVDLFAQNQALKQFLNSPKNADRNASNTLPDYVSPYQSKYPPFQEVNPGGANPANDFRSPTADDFLLQQDPNNPGHVIKSPNGNPAEGNYPVGFVPTPNPPYTPPLQGSQQTTAYHVVIEYATGNFDGSYGETQTREYFVFGRVSGIVNVNGSLGFYHRGSDSSLGVFEGINRAENVRGYDGATARNKVTMVSSNPLPGYPPDPGLPSQPTNPLPQVPTNSQGKPDLAPYNPTSPNPSPVSPTSRAKSPSPTNSPSGNPSPTVRPSSTPKLNPSEAETPFRLPSLDDLNLPENPLDNLRNPFNNPFLDNNPFNNGDSNPSNEGQTNVTINGEPVDSPSPNKSNQRIVNPDGNVNEDGSTEYRAKQNDRTNPPPPPEPSRNTCNDPCQQKLSDKLDEQAGVLISYKHFTSCNGETGEPDYETKSVKVAKNLADALKETLDNLAETQGLQCKINGLGEVTYAPPESHQARPLVKPPQLVVVFAEKFASGKLGASRWSLTIPYYTGNSSTKPKLPDWQKGSLTAVQKLNDGTTLIVNAKDKFNANRILKAMMRYVDRKYLQGITRARYVENPDKKLKQVNVTPVTAKYYEKDNHTVAKYSLKLRSK